jgi:ligand-binding SRPBCC domain-containing protein
MFRRDLSGEAMRTQKLKTEIWLPRDRASVFAFFSDPKNLEELTPDWLHFEILTPTPVKMAAGGCIDYRLRWHGIGLRWCSEITTWEPPERFVDRQIRGPYRVWIHEHTFAALDGGTLVGDTVEYATPGGILIDKWLVARDLDRIFTYRHQRLYERFGGDPSSPKRGCTPAEPPARLRGLGA